MGRDLEYGMGLVLGFACPSSSATTNFPVPPAPAHPAWPSKYPTFNNKQLLVQGQVGQGLDNLGLWKVPCPWNRIWVVFKLLSVTGFSDSSFPAALKEEGFIKTENEGKAWPGKKSSGLCLGWLLSHKALL